MRRDDQEVSLRYSVTEKRWEVFSNATRLRKRLRRWAKEWNVRPNETAEFIEFTIPFKAITLAKPRKRRRLSRQQRKTLAQQAKAMGRIRQPVVAV